MEHQAKSKVTLSDGREIEVEALRTKHVAQVGGLVAIVLLSFEAGGSDIKTILRTASPSVVSAIVELISLCSTLKVAELNELPLVDTMKLVDAWSDANKLDEIAPTFFSLGRKISKAREKALPPKPKQI